MKLRGFILAIKPQRVINENFWLQDVYLDCSNYNNLTGEKYPNFTRIQIPNEKASLDGLQAGQLVEVEFDIRGRFFERKDGTGTGFMQEVNAFKIEPVLNTGGEKIFQQEDQRSTVQIPA